MATPILLPQLGMTMEEGTVSKWLKSTGESIARGEPLLEIETEKITFTIDAPSEGIVHIAAPEGEKLRVGALLGYLLAPGELVPAEVLSERLPSASALGIPQEAAPPRQAGALPASPLARRLAAELGVDLSTVQGTGPQGRIGEADVRRAAEAATLREVPPTPGAPEGQPLRGIRRAIAERMRESLQGSAQYTLALEVDFTTAQGARRRHQQLHRQRITMADLIVRGVAEALSRYPQLNATLKDGLLTRQEAVHIGLAVALDEGLLVPVIRDADRLTLEEIAAASVALVERARAGQLTPDDLAGGTFTVTVLGGVDAFTPILNSPQVAILGVGRVAEKPAVVGGAIVPRAMTTLSLTVDHQVIDGALAARFLRRLQRLLEEPQGLFEAPSRSGK